jgi:hypothetical protein
MGQPSTAEKWAQIAPEKEPALAGREVQIHPGELLATLEDRRLQVVLLDVRPEAEYNLFHIRDAVNMPLASISSIIPDLHAKQALNLIFVVMSNDEDAATEAWKILTAEKVPNVYILEGGINYWLSIFGKQEAGIAPTPAPPGSDNLQYKFTSALGDRYEASDPNPHEWELEYEPKIKLEIPRDKSGGGCG